MNFSLVSLTTVSRGQCRTRHSKPEPQTWWSLKTSEVKCSELTHPPNLPPFPSFKTDNVAYSPAAHAARREITLPTKQRFTQSLLEQRRKEEDKKMSFIKLELAETISCLRGRQMPVFSVPSILPGFSLSYQTSGLPCDPFASICMRS